MNHKVAPSILSANFLNLGKEIEMLNESEADWIHIDVMDGVFVPNISFGFRVLDFVKKAARKPLDVHLMIVNPDQYIETFKKAGADLLTVHYEACTHLHRTIQVIKVNGMKAGVALNPHTSVSVLEDVIEELDLVLIMSVNPGFGGQKFIPYTLEKVKQVRAMCDAKGLNTDIQVDGGVSAANVREVLEAGANVFVAGSAVFGSEPAARVKEFNEIFKEYEK